MSGSARPALVVTLDDGRSLTITSHVKVLAVEVDNRGTTRIAVEGRGRAAMATWFRNQRWFCCRRVPLVHRLESLYASAGAAFLCGAGGWTLHIHLAKVFGGGRQMAPRYAAQTQRHPGKPWHEWAPAGTRAARAKLRGNGIPSLRGRCCKAVYAGSGHLARAATENLAADVRRRRSPLPAKCGRARPMVARL